MSERLKYIEDNGLLEAIDVNIDMSDIGRMRIADDIKYLIEQAKKVEELEALDEEWVKYQLDVNEIIKQLEEQNKRYREALSYIKTNTHDFHLYSVIEAGLKNKQ